ncbi:MAG: PIN domain-containing protein [Dehalococcoidia bacterium]
MAEDLPFVDANIFLRHFRQDHAEHSPRATAFLQRIETSDERARTADTVVFETVFLLERTYREPRATIRDILLPFLLLPNMVLPNKRRMHRAFRLYVAHPKLSFAGCFHIALMEGLGLSVMASFDQKISQVRTITRRSRIVRDSSPDCSPHATGARDPTHEPAQANQRHHPRRRR